jgi:hypothetical protein
MYGEGCSEIIVTNWTKGSPHENTHYGFAYGADRCWDTAGGREEFDRRYAKLAFGTSDHSICNLYEMLSLKIPYAEGVSWHERDQLNRFDLSGFRFPEKWKRYTSPEQEPQALEQLQMALDTSRTAKAILDELAPQCTRGKRQLELLLTSTQCIQAKAQFALALHMGHRFENSSADRTAILRWSDEQPATLTAWREAKRTHRDALAASGFAPALEFLNELMFEPAEYDSLVQMGSSLASRSDPKTA